MNKHTKGAWFITQDGYSTIYVEARLGGGMLQEVAACGPTEAWQQQEANARLIASAPDMLKVLQKIHAYGYTSVKDFDMVRDVISQATGEPA